MTPDFYLFRHGETDWNAEGRLQGRADRQLTEVGRGQARASSALLKSDLGKRGLIASDFVFVSSPLARAQETLAIVLAELEAGGWTVDDRLLELDYGAWEGLKVHEVKARHGNERRRRKTDRWNFRPVGGESYDDLAARVGDWLTALNRPSIVCAHAGIVRVLMHRLAGLSADEAATMRVPQPFVLRFADGRLDRLGEENDVSPEERAGRIARN